MKAETVKSWFEKLLPADLISEQATTLGVQKRERHLDVVELVVSMVLMGGSPEAGRLAAAVRDYFDRGNRRVARGAYYKWFDAEFLELMKLLSGRAMQAVAEMPVHLPGILSGRRDWRAFDSTTIKLDDALKEQYPGAGDYAALKVHVELSLGTENVVAYHISPAREHDSPHLTIDESRRGTGLLVDLGYVSHKLFRECAEYDVDLVVRLKDGWRLRLDDTVTGTQAMEWIASEEAVEVLGDGRPLDELPHESLDIDVLMGDAADPARARLITVETPDGYRSFLTTLPRSTHTAAEVSMLYRLRWSIELQNKLAKTGCQLDEITARTPVPAETLVHAAMIASILANGIAHLEHVDQGLVGEKARRLKRPPTHAMLVWKCITTSGQRLAELIVNPSQTRKTWAQVADFLEYGGQDVNWKRRPSPIDQVKGRTAAGRPWRDTVGRRCINGR